MSLSPPLGLGFIEKPNLRNNVKKINAFGGEREVSTRPESH